MPTRKKPGKRTDLQAPRRLVKESAAAYTARAPYVVLQPTGVTPHDMVDAGLSAFWQLADRWALSAAEQNALLNVSDSTRLRWQAGALPEPDDNLLDRLQLLLLSYQRLNEIAGTDAESAALLRRPGSARDPATPAASMLDALSSKSLLVLQRHYSRLEGLIGGW